MIYIYIYGAGVVGQRLCDIIQYINKEWKIVAFIRTELKERYYINNIPVITIDEVENKNAIIIVGVSEMLTEEVVQGLQGRKFRNIIYSKKC